MHQCIGLIISELSCIDADFHLCTSMHVISYHLIISELSCIDADFHLCTSMHVISYHLIISELQ